ncbi:branched-chain amino acid transport system II carrier protein [Gillisia sp. M10.2A]|uniref:Branched-chain amino acid transport system II carrier protein n=1 Tax=Gillisia lutea TaxID=2909668 RepID=A0ABS9EF43_9FLAO|nr:branched-chain amino acid transport system II carrier protein [Gillisia lutea]MCF4100499.1 branched-chain amino acid transport system II carrier protein [Gillisia lutea]
MKFNKEAFVVGFALFALFFGAGNLILPPLIGFAAGREWYLVALGFVISGVGLPLLGIFAHARLQGGMFDFAKKISPLFSLIFCIIIYLICALLPAPRTAAVTHEIAIAPYFDISALTTSILYFGLVFIFVIKRSTVINNIGKFLTPAILLLLLIIVVNGIFSSHPPMLEPVGETPVLSGFFEGYQTFDAIAALVVGGVIIISVKLKGYTKEAEIRQLITSAAILAGLSLFLIYGGLIYNGALVNAEFAPDVTRTELLSGISFLSVGAWGKISLAILVALACFTTAVGIVTGIADFITERIHNTWVYPVTVSLTCILGVVMGALSVDAIINIALPILLLIYPLTIVLILLNVMPAKLRTRKIMIATVVATIIFSLPDALKYILEEGVYENLQTYIPLSAYGLGWVIPAFLSFWISYFWETNNSNITKATA